MAELDRTYTEELFTEVLDVIENTSDDMPILLTGPELELERLFDLLTKD